MTVWNLRWLVTTQEVTRNNLSESGTAIFGGGTHTEVVQVKVLQTLKDDGTWEDIPVVKFE